MLLNETINRTENDDIDLDAPSTSDSENEVLRNGFHDNSDNADDESSDNDEDLPPHIEAFMNPVYNGNDININDSDDSHSGEGGFDGLIYGLNFMDHERNTPSELSDDNQIENQPQRNALNHQENLNQNYLRYGERFQHDSSNNSGNDNLSDDQHSTSESSDYEDTRYVPQQDTSSVSETNTSFNLVSSESRNDEIVVSQSDNVHEAILTQCYPNWFNNDYFGHLYILCDDDFIESLGTSGTNHSTPNFAAFNASFDPLESPIEDLFSFDRPGNSHDYPHYYCVRGNAGYTETSGYVSPENAICGATQASYRILDTNFENIRYANPYLYYRNDIDPFSTIYNSRNYLWYSTYYEFSDNYRYLAHYSANYKVTNSCGCVVHYSTVYGYQSYTIPSSTNDRFPNSHRYGLPNNAASYAVPCYGNNCNPGHYVYTSPHSLHYQSNRYQGTSINYSSAQNYHDCTGPPLMNYNASDNLHNSSQQFINNAEPHLSHQLCITDHHLTTDNHGYSTASTQYYVTTSLPLCNNLTDSTQSQPIQSNPIHNDTKLNDTTWCNTSPNNACCRNPQASDNFYSETPQSNSYISPSATADETTNSSVYRPQNLSDYDIPNSFTDPSPASNSLYNYAPHYSNAPFPNYSAPMFQNSQGVSGNASIRSPGYGNYVSCVNEASNSSGPHICAVSGTHYYNGNRTPGLLFRSTHGPIAYIAPTSNRYPGPILNRYSAPGFYGYPDPRFQGYMGPLGSRAQGFAGIRFPNPSVVPNFARCNTSSITNSGVASMVRPTAPDASNTFNQYSPANSFNDHNHDHGSPNSSAYWIGNEFNLHTIFDSNGFLIDRDDMERAILRYMDSDERYIPVVRLQSEAASNDGDSTIPQFERASSNVQRGRLPPFGSSSISQSRPMPDSTRARSHGHGAGYNNDGGRGKDGGLSDDSCYAVDGGVGNQGDDGSRGDNAGVGDNASYVFDGDVCDNGSQGHDGGVGDDGGPGDNVSHGDDGGRVYYSGRGHGGASNRGRRWSGGRDSDRGSDPSSDHGRGCGQSRGWGRSRDSDRDNHNRSSDRSRGYGQGRSWGRSRGRSHGHTGEWRSSESRGGESRGFERGGCWGSGRGRGRGRGLN